MQLHDPSDLLRREPAGGKPRTALILIHGRGSSADDLIPLADYLSADECLVLAPQAAGGSWYPQRFIAPLGANEPWLSSALEVIDTMLTEITDAGVSLDQTVLAGFSQGACLAIEYAVRHPGRYGAIGVLSGALIGPPDEPYTHAGNLEGTPVLFGCAENDAHIPIGSVHASALKLEEMGAVVTKQIYPGFGHTVYPGELDWLCENWPAK